MKINYILAGTLSLVLIAGLGTPAFADPSTLTPTGTNSPFDSADFVTPLTADPDDIVYENGNPDESGLNLNIALVANDFVLEEDFPITDVHFIFLDTSAPFGWDGPFQYQILQDAEGTPGNKISEGTGVKVEVERIEDSEVGQRFIVWFDLEEPVPELSGGVTYWLALHAGTDITDRAPKGMFWEFSDVIIGNSLQFTLLPDEDKWDSLGADTWFQLTSKQPAVVVGGEFLPIDSTALALAGLQTSAIWMLPVLAGVAGSAFGVLYIKSRRN